MAKEEQPLSPDQPKPKNEKLSLEEYEKVKAKRTKERFKTKFPWFITVILTTPLVVVIGLLLIYFFYAKNLPIR